MKQLKAPFPAFGGKSQVAADVWSRFGNVDNYIEPFCFSSAVLLRRPDWHFDGHPYRTETITDTNHFVANFWRAVKNDPDAVAKYADQPVIECDLHARHKYLCRGDAANQFVEKMQTDPEYFDAKFAGYWCWGACCWIGGAWCVGPRADYLQVPQIDKDKGVNGRPQLADAYDLGRGVNSAVGSTQVPELSYGTGRGVLNCVGETSRGVANQRYEFVLDWMRRLQDRLRNVRVCYGHWSRICDSESTLTRLDKGNGVGVFLDPPYPTESVNGKKSRADSLYVNDKHQDLNALRDEVLEWCRKWGQSPQIKVAVCGYEGDGYESLIGQGWTETAWKANGGYANRKGKEANVNADRERIWWSPACIQAKSLFECCE